MLIAEKGNIVIEPTLCDASKSFLNNIKPFASGDTFIFYNCEIVLQWLHDENYFEPLWLEINELCDGNMFFMMKKDNLFIS